MKIVTPLSNTYSYERLAEAGADEFFCGYVPMKWLEKYTNIMPFNRRESLSGYHNITEKGSMKIIRRMVEKHKIPVKVTFNSHYYVQSQYPLLMDVVKDLIDMGFNTFIIADIAFVIYLREKGIKCDIHISGEMEVYNSSAVRFLSQFDISRVVFPRKVTLQNIKDLICNSKLNSIEYEAFILNAMCLYSGAFCNGIHSDELPFICEIPFRMKRLEGSIKFKSAEKALNKMVNVQNYSQHNKQNPQIGQGNFSHSLATSGCGLCRIKELMDIRVTHLKVVGRGCILDTLIKDIQYTKKAVNFAKEAASSDEYINKIRSEFFDNMCTYLCYYPTGLSKS